MTNTISPFPPYAASLTHTLSLSLSAILPSSPPSLFDIKMVSDDFKLSMNKQIPLRTVLISKVTSIQKLSVRFPLLASERDDPTQQLLQRPVVVGQPKQPPQDTVEREEVFERR